jgi:MoxR-like ATPase
MKPQQIYDVLNLAREIRKKGEVFIPMFVGPPGVGKSFLGQQWAKAHGLQFLDLRSAYLENPDVKGYPQPQVKDGREVTTHFTPEMWPTGGEGLLALEEVNRGTNMVMNCWMQLLTDFKIDKYTLPPGWVIAGFINPEDEQYCVNTMDAALKNRFEFFHIEYDKDSFVDYMKSQDYDKMLVSFVESGIWSYKTPEQIADLSGNKYISPRTISRMNSVLKTGTAHSIELETYQAIFGTHYGLAFFKFKHDERPIMYKDLVEDKKRSIAKLKQYSDESNYNNAQISITTKSIIEEKVISDELLTEVLLILPSDQSMGLIQAIELVRKENLLERLTKASKPLHRYLKEHLKAE